MVVVVVHEAHQGQGPGHTRIDIADPVAMLSLINNPTMRLLAQEARTRLQRVIASLQ